jgi:hypothetical protein
MKKLTDVRNALAENEFLSIAATAQLKGGDGADATEDEKRRQRPGGGISTNSTVHGFSGGNSQI